MMSLFHKLVDFFNEFLSHIRNSSDDSGGGKCCLFLNVVVSVAHELDNFWCQLSAHISSGNLTESRKGQCDNVMDLAN